MNTPDPTINARAASYAADSGLVVFGVLTLQEWAALVGIVLAVATFGVNWYYQRSKAKRERERHSMLREEHEHYMEQDDNRSPPL